MEPGTGRAGSRSKHTDDKVKVGRRLPSGSEELSKVVTNYQTPLHQFIIISQKHRLSDNLNQKREGAGEEDADATGAAGAAWGGGYRG